MSADPSLEALRDGYDIVHGSAVPRPRSWPARELGGLVPYIWLGERLTNARRLHYVNNTSAVAALAKGYSGSPDSGHLVHALHATALGLGCSCYFEYVLLHYVEYTV